MAPIPTFEGRSWFADSPIAMLVHEERAQPVCGLHRHDFMELVLIRSGTGKHVLDGGAFAVGPGDAFVIPPGMAHGYDDCRKLALVNVLWDPERVRLPVYDLGRIGGYHALFRLEPRLRSEQGFRARLHLDSQAQRQLSTLVQNLAEELAAAQPGCTYVSVSVLMQIIAFLARAYAGEAAPQERSVLGLGDVLRVMEERYAEELEVEELAQVAGVSVSTLQRLFKRALDASPVTYLNQLRVRRACDLLREQPWPVQRIAEQVGFADANYFARVFRRQLGCSPRAYRQAQQTLNDRKSPGN